MTEISSPSFASQSSEVDTSVSFYSRATRHVVFVLLSAWLLYEGAWGTNPQLFGDAPEYALMTHAIGRHGTPDLRPGDTNRPDVEQILGKPPEYSKQFLLGFISTDDGRWYCWHFFFYPIINLPMGLLTIITGIPGLKTFTLTNAVLIIAVVGQLLYATRYPLGLQLVAVAMFVWSSALWYFAWPHPEIMTCAFVFMSAISWFHERRYTAILLAALAAMQNPPLFLLTLYYMLPTLFRRVSNIRRNVLLCGITSFWVVVPPLFYRYHYGVGSLIVDFGYLDYSMITVRRFIGFFFDINQGMIVGMPTSLPLFLFLYGLACMKWFIRRGQEISSKNSLYLLLIPIMIAMTFFIMPMKNWNHGQSGINRYATWCSMIPLAYLIELLSHGWNNKRLLASLLLLVIPQIYLVQHYGGTHADGEAYRRHKELPSYLLSHFPRLYNPDPQIFIARTLGLEVNSSEFAADAILSECKLPHVVPYLGIDGKIRKLAVRKGAEHELVEYGWSEDDIHRVVENACYVNHWAYLHPGDFQESPRS